MNYRWNNTWIMHVWNTLAMINMSFLHLCNADEKDIYTVWFTSPRRRMRNIWNRAKTRLAQPRAPLHSTPPDMWTTKMYMFVRHWGFCGGFRTMWQYLSDIPSMITSFKIKCTQYIQPRMMMFLHHAIYTVLFNLSTT